MNGISPFLTDDFIWNPLIMRVGSKRLTPSSFVNVNCPMCSSRGESEDKRQRCGIKHDLSGIGIYCFNCGFKARYRAGGPLSRNMRDFLHNVGVSSLDVQRMAHHALALRQMANRISERTAQETIQAPVITTTHRLPADALPIKRWADEGCDDPDFLEVCAYLLTRGDVLVDAVDYHWSPSTDHALKHRLIIPFRHGGEIVGWTARRVRDGIDPKYWTTAPRDFLYNVAALENPNRRVVVLVEGIFDAIALDCVGLLGARLNERQAAWINHFGKEVIVLPDQDRAGKRLVETALRHGWKVAFPRLSTAQFWDRDVKDAAEAVRRYDRLWTLHSVIASAESSKFQIEANARSLRF